MKVRRRQRGCGETDYQCCDIFVASRARRRIARVDINVSVDLAQIIASLTVIMLMFFHFPD